MSTQFKRISCDGKQFWNMPVIGIGTFRMKGMECQRAVEHALKTGYRHIDTAECYQNGTDIANAIQSFNSKHNCKDDESKESDDCSMLQRKDIFITSKLSPKSMKTQQKVESAILNCVKSLQTDYIDLFLIHWPGVSGKKVTDPKLREHRLMAWNTMEQFVNKGIIRCIGVSNFEIQHLQPLMDAYEQKQVQYQPAVHQFEFHPYYRRMDLIAYCQKHNIQLSAYGSLGAAESHNEENMQNGKHALLHHTLILELAKKYSKTAAQVLLRYGLQRDCMVIPKSKTLRRIEENFNIFDFELDDDDLLLMDKIGEKQQTKFAWNPSIIH